MMSRDVMGRQMFANGGPAMPQPEMGMDQMAMMAQEQGVDPAQLQGALEMAQGQMQQIDNAENYEQVINGIRGDQQPIEARYAELTSVVGQEDSQATPESVLTLLQPVMQMAAVDQGIGGLAAEEMTAPIEGPMAEGIMSTVGMGEPDPVNFSQGGPVIHMAEGGAPSTYENDLNNRYKAVSNVMANILGSEDREAALADQRRMTQAQMLFDIAQGGLALASPTERSMSFGERLATSFNPVFGNIGARAGELEKFKQGQAAEQRALDLQALGQAQSELSAEKEQKFRADQASIERNLRRDLAKADRRGPTPPKLSALSSILSNKTLNNISLGANVPVEGFSSQQLLNEVLRASRPTTTTNAAGDIVRQSGIPLSGNVLLALASHSAPFAAEVKKIDPEYYDKVLQGKNQKQIRSMYIREYMSEPSAVEPSAVEPSALPSYVLQNPDINVAEIPSSIGDARKRIDDYEKLPPEDKGLYKNPHEIFYSDAEGVVHVIRDHPALLNEVPLSERDIDFAKQYGIGAFISDLDAGVDDFLSELGKKYKPDTEKYRRGKSVARSLHNSLLQREISEGSGRVLKYTQDQYAKEFENLTKKGLGNSKAKGTIANLLTGLEEDLKEAQRVLPQLGGTGYIGESPKFIKDLEADYNTVLRRYISLGNMYRSLSSDSGPNRRFEGNRSREFTSIGSASDKDALYEFVGIKR